MYQALPLPSGAYLVATIEHDQHGAVITPDTRFHVKGRAGSVMLRGQWHAATLFSVARDAENYAASLNAVDYAMGTPAQRDQRREIAQMRRQR